ncbi:sideroflexin-2 isoform X5 [Trachypithecus francoisi]|uniref:sideroflexin-2 isoform X5 n=1 Tax=Trachypithecus francoisi TaxID=54180 RepID=UPI00141BD374|nr:sideroflexin-2 isoform X5 [Trachypithecus francoisi]
MMYPVRGTEGSTVLCVNKMEADLTGFNIDAPRWDQRTFLGRVKHFLNITDPRTVFVSEQELDWAKVMVEKSRMGVVPPGTQVEQLLYAKKLYDSAFHPDTGEKMNVIGRMSFQLPGGMIITGFMLQFYRTMPVVIFWQWVNQSFNALVNYTNRNAASPISVRQMTLSYFTATTTAVATAVGMNMLTKKAPPLVGRWVPFAAVAAANCVNIPMMRQQELIQGICVKDRNENEIGHSRRAAAIGITQVVISRITMSAPGMILLPVVMERLEKLHFMQKVKVLHAPLQVMLCGYFLIFMVPVACGLFPQKCELPISYLEPELQDTIKANSSSLLDFLFSYRQLLFWKYLEGAPGYLSGIIYFPTPLRTTIPLFLFFCCGKLDN